MGSTTETKNRIREFGETNLINIVRNIVGSTEDNDVEYMYIDGITLAMKIDGLSLTTSKMPFMTHFDMGWKVMASVVSDFLAKLTKPLYAVVSITMRGDDTIGDFRELIRGLGSGANYFGMRYLGGDLNEGADDVIDVAAIGKPMTRPIGRKPRIGDVLVTKPLFGYTGLVFKLYYSNELDRWKDVETVMKGIEILKRPEPEVGILNDLLKHADCISASMDSSDGLGKVLWTMATNGKVRIRVYGLPINDDLLSSLAEIPGVKLEEVVFNGGEEFLPVFSVREDCVAKFRDLGFVDFARIEEGNGVYFNDSPLKFRGWDYFTGWTG
ncbi:thiamine-phosphate kinase [Vulcanisaeta souniana]|uniref:Thiamine-monophosphate kinase n=2 Tax=Vulcanisaeta souniana TaxID=164452 RepID=A0A830EBU9_9CREN|nr:AIR synthase related protein [Vulcanisaeta souniana]BDR92196.1 thiamine-monophosphate kinase [Vulcanisaeta souniana JCM 11219]GGI67170.1 thiamine-monophosphate kinase [Vulcanisaeta souniana JCM 11219]